MLKWCPLNSYDKAGVKSTGQQKAFHLELGRLPPTSSPVQPEGLSEGQAPLSQCELPAP